MLETSKKIKSNINICIIFISNISLVYQQIYLQKIFTFSIPHALHHYKLKVILLKAKLNYWIAYSYSYQLTLTLWDVEMVFETLIADLLNRYLGNYLETLNASQLSLGLLSG